MYPDGLFLTVPATIPTVGTPCRHITARPAPTHNSRLPPRRRLPSPMEPRFSPRSKRHSQYSPRSDRILKSRLLSATVRTTSKATPPSPAGHQFHQLFRGSVGRSTGRSSLRPPAIACRRRNVRKQTNRTSPRRGCTLGLDVELAFAGARLGCAWRSRGLALQSENCKFPATLQLALRLSGNSLSMPVDQLPRPPFCPACGADMQLSRVVERTHDSKELQVFQCRPCGVSYTRGAPTDDDGRKQ